MEHNKNKAPKHYIICTFDMISKKFMRRKALEYIAPNELPDVYLCHVTTSGEKARICAQQSRSQILLSIESGCVSSCHHHAIHVLAWKQSWRDTVAVVDTFRRVAGWACLIVPDPLIPLLQEGKSKGGRQKQVTKKKNKNCHFSDDVVFCWWFACPTFLLSVLQHIDSRLGENGVEVDYERF